MAGGRLWTQVEDAELSQSAHLGATAIAAKLGRSEHSITGRAHVLRVRLGRCDPRRDMTTEEEFLKRVEYDTNGGCWLYSMSIAKSGYADANYRGKSRTRAHRIAWEIWRGPIPTGLLVCHRCDVRNCVNPDHLFLGTHQDNNDDKFSKGRARNQNGPVTKGRKPKPRRVRKVRTHCRRGHPYEGLRDEQGFQRCRICARDNMREQRRRKREKP